MHCFGERQRTPPTQIANAVHADCERHPHRPRTPSTQITNAVHADRGRYTTTKVDVLFDKS